jgi:uridine kinase
MKHAAQGRYVIGIAGGSASGKTSFLRQMEEEMPKGSICMVSQDNYYKPKAEQKRDSQGEVNYDLPTSIDQTVFQRDVQALIRGEAIQKLEYTFNTPGKEPQVITVEPAPIIVVEGLFVFHYKEIRDLLDLRVYLDVREEIKLQRRIQRDAEERGYSEQTVRYQWDHHVLPSYKKFLKPYRDEAHVIITNNITYDKGLLVLCDHLRYRLGTDLMRSSNSEGVIGAAESDTHSLKIR